MSGRDDIFGTASAAGSGSGSAPGDGASERVRERALAAQRLAEVAKRLAPADGTGAQRAAWQDAQVASIMAAEALAALPGDPDLARAMADEAQSLAIGALKAAQAATAAEVPATPSAGAPAASGAAPSSGIPVGAGCCPPAGAQQGAPTRTPNNATPPAPAPARPAASEPASHAAWREAVPALAPASPQAAPGSGIPVASHDAPSPGIPVGAGCCPPAGAQQGAPTRTSDNAAPPAPDAAQASPEPATQAAAAVAPAKRSHRLRTACIALAGVLLAMVGLVGAAWWGLLELPEPVQERLYLLPDAHAQAGRLNASEAEVVPGSFQLVLNQLCSMDEGSLDCPIEFENPAANAYAARVILEVDGLEVARSGMVAPGSYLPTLRLDGALDVGDHEARAVVRVYSGATQVNTLASDVTVRVK